MEALRYTAVSVGGVIVDLAIAYALVRVFGLPLWLGATAGFVLAAIANYAAHELWTFQAGQRQISPLRAAHYLAASTLTLATRLAVIALVTEWIGPSHTLAILIAGAGVSFGVNFVLSKFLIFNRNQKPRSTDR